MNRISKLLAICCIAVLLSGCEEPTPRAIIAQANARGKITDWQAESLSKVESLAELAGFLPLNGLTSITDRQAEILSGVENLYLNGLTSIANQQVESLSRVEYLSVSMTCMRQILSYQRKIVEKVNSSGTITAGQAAVLNRWLGGNSLDLNGFTSITDQQAESLSKVSVLGLNSLTSITDQQAESLSKVSVLSLNGLTTITDEQAVA